jgi:hypothetical protein
MNGIIPKYFLTPVPLGSLRNQRMNYLDRRWNYNRGALNFVAE